MASFLTQLLPFGGNLSWWSPAGNEPASPSGRSKLCAFLVRYRQGLYAVVTLLTYPVDSSIQLLRIQRTIPVLGRGVPLFSGVLSCLWRRPVGHLWRGSFLLITSQLMAFQLYPRIHRVVLSLCARCQMTSPRASPESARSRVRLVAAQIATTALVVTITHPLRVLQVLLVSDVDLGYSGLRGLARCVWKYHGVRGYFVGLLSAVGAVVVYESTRYTSYTLLCHKFSRKERHAHAASLVVAALLSHVLESLSLVRVVQSAPTPLKKRALPSSWAILWRSNLTDAAVTTIAFTTLLRLATVSTFATK